MVEEVVTEKLKAIVTEHNGEFYVNESKWWNGRAYLPLQTYRIKYQFNQTNVDLNLEIRENEFSKSTRINIANEKTRCIGEIMAVKEKPSLRSSFKINVPSIWQSLFNYNAQLPFAVKCKDQSVAKKLNNIKELHQLYELAKNSAEFNPEFSGQMNDQSFSLSVRFTLTSNEVVRITAINTCCKELLKII